jgi:triosephosphate isomerase
MEDEASIMRTPWIGTSWKMNKLRSEAKAYAAALKESPHAQADHAQLFIIPPFPSIAEVADILAGTRVRVGAQNMHWEDQGAWTGEVSAPMVKDCGATLAEIGHSERRMHFGETDQAVGLKVRAALRHGLTPLVCIGDTRSEYEAGRTAEVLERQTRLALEHASRSDAGRIVLAYEPVWSIGEGGTPADPEFASEQQGRVKAITRDVLGVDLPVLYGGSVNPDNCVALASRPHIDGLFIGRSAWDVAGYLGIVEKVVTALRRST